MARRLRINRGGNAYHVLNRRAGRMPLFGTDDDYAAFGKVLDEAYGQPSWQVRTAAHLKLESSLRPPWCPRRICDDQKK